MEKNLAITKNSIERLFSIGMISAEFLEAYIKVDSNFSQNEYNKLFESTYSSLGGSLKNISLIRGNKITNAYA